MYPEMKALVIERGDGVADDLVGQLAHRLLHQGIRLRNFGAGKLAGHAHRGCGIEIEDNATFDIAGEPYQGGDALAAVGFLFHAEIPDDHRGPQALR